MGLGLTKTTIAYGKAVWQCVSDNAVGGFLLNKLDISDDVEIVAGTPVGFDESTRIATILKTAKVYADATNTATTIQVKKGHLFKVGNYIGHVIGGKAYAITAIDTTNSSYDTLTVGTTLGVALVAGDTIFQSSATGATACVYYVTPKALSYATVIMSTGQAIDAVIEGIVYARRIPSLDDTIKAQIRTVSDIVFSDAY